MARDLAAMHRSSDGPAWRSKLAEKLPERRSHRQVLAFDADVQRFHHFVHLRRSKRGGPQKAMGLYPDLAAAETLNESPKLARLKIAVLGGLSPEEIADRLRVKAAVLDAWERFFFDVRPSREVLGWVFGRVIEPERAAGRAEFAAQLKFAAMAGPVGARALLDSDVRSPVEDGQRLFDRRLNLYLKFNAAIEMPLDSPRAKLAFIKAYLLLTQRERRLQLDEKRLQIRSQEALNRHERAKRRAESAFQRAELREAARDQRARERRAIRELNEQRQHEWWRYREAQYASEMQAASVRAKTGALAQLKWGRSPAESAAWRGAMEVPSIPTEATKPVEWLAVVTMTAPLFVASATEATITPFQHQLVSQI